MLGISAPAISSGINPLLTNNTSPPSTGITFRDATKILFTGRSATAPTIPHIISPFAHAKASTLGLYVLFNI